MKSNLKNFFRYSSVLIAVLLAILLRFALAPLVGQGVPYISIFIVTSIVAMLAGIWPAILTGILCTIATDYFFIPPIHSVGISISFFAQMAVVVLTSAFIGYMGDSLRAARSRAEKQSQILNESQNDLNLAQVVANTGSWRMNVQQNQLTWSDETYRIFGVPKGTPLTYESFLAIVHPDDREYVDMKWKSGLQGEPYDIEHRIVVDGQIKWVREKAYLEFDKDKHLIGGFGIAQDITERIEIEQALRASEQRWRDLAESMPQFIWTCTPEGKCDYLSQQWINYTGKPEAEQLGYGWLEHVHPDDRENLMTAWNEAVCNLRRFDVEFRLRRHNGIYRWFKTRALPIRDNNGQVIKWYGSNTDINDIKQTQESLRKINEELEQRVRERTSQLSKTIEVLQEEVAERIKAEKESREKSDILDALFTSTTTPLVLLDRNFNFIRVSDTYAKACQRDVSEFEGHNHFDFYPHAENQAIFEDVVRTKKPYMTIAKPFEFPDHPEWGVTYWDWTLFPLLDEKGEVEFLVFSLEDVTKRTRIEKALLDSEERYRGLTVATAQIIWTTNSDGQVIEDIPTWRAFTGQMKEQILGWGWSEALHPDDLERTKAIWTQSIKKHTPYDTEYRIRGKDGQYRCFSVRGVPILEEDGTVREWVGTCTDITEKKNAEILTKVTNSLLELFAKQTSKKEYLDSVVETISGWSGCQCIGIRLLDEAGFISYASHKGFPVEFLELENNLSIKNDACVCIRVITEQMNAPDKSLMTTRGSFHCNDTAGFIEGLTEKEKNLFRGNCMKFGYASVCVVPIRYREKILGAIHLADERAGMVPAEKVEFLENMAMLVGEAVHRFDMEDELRESEERYRELVELSPDGIGVEINEKIAFVNSAGAKILGAKSSQELIGRNIADFIHPDFRRRALKLLSYMRKKGVTLPPREAKFVRLDGTDFDVEVAATALMYKDKSAAQIVFRDISHRKAAEKELMTNQEKLRSLTAELVLTEERERRAAAMALHDSLGPILAFSKRELGLLQKTMSKKDADALKHISNNISDAVQQTRNLTFDLSPPTLYTFGLETAVAELTEKFAVEQNIQIAFEKDEESRTLPDHLKVLLYRSVRELLINIAKHSGARNVRLAMSQFDDNIKIVVEDDGKGFEMPMYKAKTFWTKGFGLFSIRERLTHVGGTIDIQSSRGKGTVVTLLAPLGIENNKKEVS